jgi:hypothetical protein
LNYPDVSEVELEMILAHEFGHYFDPDAQSQRPLPLRPSVRADVLELSSCYERSFIDSDGQSRSVTGEDFADWMASNVAPFLIRDGQPNADIQKKRALNLAYSFCEPVSPVSRLIRKVEQGAGPDPHAKGEDRILTVMKNPEILQAIGCGPVLVRQSTGAEIGQCAPGTGLTEQR